MQKIKSGLLLVSILLLTLVLFTQCDIAKKKALEQVVDSVNERAPIRMDEYTILLGAELVGTTLQYNYQLLSNVETITHDDNRHRIETSLLYDLSQDKSIREVEATISYQYADTLGNVVMQFKFEPKEYLNFSFDNLNVYDELQKQVAIDGAALPLQVNEMLTVQSMQALEPNILVTTYVLSGLKEADVARLKTSVLQSSAQDVKNNPSMMHLRAMGITFRYIYLNENNEELVVVDVAAADYQ